MERKRSIKDQVQRKVAADKAEKPKRVLVEGPTISTGSTLLDLAISGGNGLPGGIFVEIFGPSGTGKTVLLSEIAGGVKRAGGDVMFNDPEGRLNKQFAQLFDLNMDEIEYYQPNTVPETFLPIHKWEPENADKINGIMADSLAALSTDMEMDKDEGDKMGGRRAKEFSEHLRKVARVLTQKNYLLVASNQIREKMDAMAFGEKYYSPGGKAIEFYASVRLKVKGPVEKMKRKIKVKGKELQRTYGIVVEVEVVKNSVAAPYKKALVSIIFDYGIDDIRENLKFIKQHTGATTYELGGESLDKSLDVAIQKVEENGLEKQLKDEVTELWYEIENKFSTKRTKKKRV
jgi:recombination protein RecA